MKLLLVFVSALALVAYGNGTPLDKEDSVHEIKSEEVAGNAGQEAGGPQVVFAEGAPAVRVFAVEEEPRVEEAYAVEDPAGERVPAPENGVYIPVVSRICTNAACANVCNQLGFKYGMCVSLDTCWCYN